MDTVPSLSLLLVNIQIKAAVLQFVDVCTSYLVSVGSTMLTVVTCIKAHVPIYEHCVFHPFLIVKMILIICACM